jgi:MraZ protein
MAEKSNPPDNELSQSALNSSEDLGFLGNSPLSLDDKLRFVVPTAFKTVLQEKYREAPGPIKVVVTISPDRFRNVAVYPRAQWKRYMAEMEQTHVLDRHSRELRRLVTSLANPCELDSAGRIRLEKKVVEVAKLEKRVVAVGCTNHFEVWDEKRFDEFVEETFRNADAAADGAMEHATAKS